MCVLSCVQLLATLWTVAHQAPLSDFPGKNTGIGLPFTSPGDLPDPGIEPASLALVADSLPRANLEALYLTSTAIKIS